MTQDAGMEKIIERVRKLLSLSRGTTPEEAASAAAKAQELLETYNLDMATVEQGGGEGKREDARVSGGMYVYERELWEAVAQLNFCWYFTTRKYDLQKNGRYKTTFQHRLVGRVVNTTGTKVMAQYLQGAIERLSEERFPLNTQRFTREAVSYREGMADNLVDRLRRRRWDREDKEAEAAEEAKRKAAASGVSTSTSLTLSAHKEAEDKANYDFLHGEGAWAKREKAQAEREQRRADAQAKAEAEYTKWAEAHPEEARKAEAKERARQRSAAQREANRSPRWRAPSEKERRQSSGYYQNGYDRGEKIGLDPQASDRRTEQKRIGR